MFTLIEVECLGACVNAPMVQINDNYYVSALQLCEESFIIEQYNHINKKMLKPETAISVERSVYI